MKVRYKKRELSFTLVETIMAIGLLAPVILYVASVQGSSIYFVEYGRKSLQAAWYAKRLMSQVEYHAATKDFKQLTVEVSNEKFQDDESEFTYDLNIQEFKLPIAGIIAQKITGGATDDAMSQTIESAIQNYLGDDIFQIAVAKVYWPEGAKRNHISTSMVIANKKKIEEILLTIGAMSQASGGGNPNIPSADSPDGGAKGGSKGGGSTTGKSTGGAP